MPSPFVPGKADVDGNGSINVLDAIAFIDIWNAAGPAADFNADGSIKILDVIVFVMGWNAGCQ